MLDFFKKLLGCVAEVNHDVVKLEQKVEAVIKEEVKIVMPKVKVAIEKVDEVINAEVKKVRAKKSIPKVED